eukprot:3730768-Rhodomonas_salina.1
MLACVLGGAAHVIGRRLLHARHPARSPGPRPPATGTKRPLFPTLLLRADRYGLQHCPVWHTAVALVLFFVVFCEGAAVFVASGVLERAEFRRRLQTRLARVFDVTVDILFLHYLHSDGINIQVALSACASLCLCVSVCLTFCL